ncbi:MAG: hypothetical protein OEX81_05285 [Candidatus Pacebacteria bacterium]|nr:hypothetical protein [Candidatus Paceibacterota bacterium]
MAFHLADICFSNWRDRIPTGKLGQLEEDGLTMAKLQNDHSNVLRLFVKTDSGIYVSQTSGMITNPIAVFASMALNPEIEMPGPVRVKAINMLVDNEL